MSHKYHFGNRSKQNEILMLPILFRNYWLPQNVKMCFSQNHHRKSSIRRFLSRSKVFSIFLFVFYIFCLFCHFLLSAFQCQLQDRRKHHALMQLRFREFHFLPKNDIRYWPYQMVIGWRTYRKISSSFNKSFQVGVFSLKFFASKKTLSVIIFFWYNMGRALFRPQTTNQGWNFMW